VLTTVVQRIWKKRSRHRITDCMGKWDHVVRKIYVQIIGDFTFWLWLLLRLSLSLNFGLSTYLSQKVEWCHWAGIDFNFWLQLSKNMASGDYLQSYMSIPASLLVIFSFKIMFKVLPFF